MIGGHVGRGDGIGCIVVGCVVPVPRIPKIIGLTKVTLFFLRLKKNLGLLQLGWGLVGIQRMVERAVVPLMMANY